MMKKMIVMFLALTLTAGTAGCSYQLTDDRTGYHSEWQALEAGVKHDTYASMDPNAPDRSTGGYESAGMWEINWIYTVQKQTVACEVDDISLKKGFYRFTTEVSINNVVSDFYGRAYDTVAEMRVQDAESGENLAYRTVGRYEFREAGALQEISLCFALEKNRKVDIFFNVVGSGGSQHRVNKLSVTGIPASEYVTTDYAYFLSEKGTTPAYDASKLYFFDLYKYIAPLSDSRAAYDVVAMTVALQGLANRGGTHLYLNYTAVTNTYYSDYIDRLWLDELTRAGGEFAGREVVEVKSFETLLKRFAADVKGLVLWDEEVPATFNVACTAAGVENLLPVRKDDAPESLCAVLEQTFGLPVGLDLDGKFTGSGKIWGTGRKSSGSAKCDAYLWALETYLKTGMTNPALMANMLDAATWDYTWKEGEQVVNYYDLQQCFLPNRDYYIQNKAFFFDLGFYENYLPGDDLNQPMGTDFRTLCEILEVQNERAGNTIINIGGFVAWYFPKYTDAANVLTGYPTAVAVEWRASEIYGWYNAVTAADAHGTEGAGIFTNASIFSQLPQRDSYRQSGTRETWYNAATKTTEPVSMELQNVNYVCVYMGDYDSAAWLNAFMKKSFLDDPARGSLPLAWCVTTGLIERSPHVFNRMYATATANDYFVGGDNGYAYNDPGSYLAEDRPTRADGKPLNGDLATYEAKLRAEWDKFDIDIMGFLISTDGGRQEIDELFARNATGGVFTNYTRTYAPVPGLIDYRHTPDNYDDDVPTMPLVTISDQTSAPATVIANVDASIGVPTQPTFTAFRAIVCTPTTIKQAVDNLDPSKRTVVVDPYTFMRLYKEYLISGLV